MYRGSNAHKAYVAAWMKEYRIRAKDKISDQRKVARSKNADEIRHRQRIYYAANPDKAAEKRRKQYAKNSDMFKLHARSRRNRKKQHKPAWMPWSDLRAAYKLCPVDMVVDHIVPLIGKVNGAHVVSGLHVPWNLQFITAFDNGSKGCVADLRSEELRLMESGI